MLTRDTMKKLKISAAVSISLVILFMAVVVMLFLTGCSRKEDYLEGAGATAKTKKEIEEIVIATVSTTESLYNAVQEFNKSQSEYHVTILDYKDSYEYEDAVNKMFLDILGEEPYDLINLSCLDYAGHPNAHDMIEKGYIADLTDYLEKSDEIKLDDFDKNALAMWSSGDFIAAIPHSYMIYTCLADSEIFDADKGISVSELIEYDRSHPDKCLFNGAGSWDVLEICLINNLRYFYNEETGESSFDSDEFREILEFAKEYHSSIGGAYSRYAPAEKEDIIKYIYLDSVYQFPDYPLVNYEGRAFYAGMPTIDGRRRHIIKEYSGSPSIAITAVSKKKDAAWNFIEFYLQMEPDAHLGFSYGFQCNRNLLEYEIKKLSVKDSTTERLFGGTIRFGPIDGGNYTVEKHPLTTEEIESLYKVIEQSEPGTEIDSPIKWIICEEVQPYFENQKSIEEVIEIIQSRVRLYLAEQK